MIIDRGEKRPIEFSSYFYPYYGIQDHFTPCPDLGNTALAQRISCSPADRTLFDAKWMELRDLQGKDLGDSLVNIGKTFLGTPYVEKTLEIGPTETLVVNLRGLDCTTFVENVLAFGLLLKQGGKDFEAFAGHLQALRYRNGKLDGYPSRLHYFSD